MYDRFDCGRFVQLCLLLPYIFPIIYVVLSIFITKVGVFFVVFVVVGFDKAFSFS